MNLLYDEKHTKLDTYEYQINGGGKYYVKESGRVTIVFENGHFKSASFPLSGQYSRNGWRILAAMNEKISYIEMRYEE